MEPEIRTLSTLGEMEELLRVADRIWGTPPGSFVSPSFLMALVHAGGYVAGAVDRSGRQPRMVGVSFGVLARHRGVDHRDHWCLHSHITGVEPGLQNSGLGRRIKQHQRAWSRDHGLAAVTWTFDPLVRRNAWFNLHVLGAVATEYHVDFYGPLGDEINGVDDTDRLLAHWAVDAPRSTAAERAPLSPIVPHPDDVLVEVPADIVALRTTDPDRAHAWRRELRADLSPLLADGHMSGLTESGQYVISRRPIEETLSHAP
jgi:predicted GNAT superfamily acetyltransferase